MPRSISFSAFWGKLKRGAEASENGRQQSLLASCLMPLTKRLFLGVWAENTARHRPLPALGLEGKGSSGFIGSVANKRMRLLFMNLFMECWHNFV